MRGLGRNPPTSGPRRSAGRPRVPSTSRGPASASARRRHRMRSPRPGGLRMRPLAFLGGISLLVAPIAPPASGQASLFGDLHPMIPWDADPSAAVALGDADGDGDLDVLVGNYGTPDRLYRNDGSGVLTSALGALPAIVNNTRALGFGDLDGDGDLDLLIGNDGIQDRLYLGNGAGAFVDATSQFPSFPGPDSTRGIALGDVDGDGDLDAIFANWLDPTRFYRHNGLGTFSNAFAEIPSD